MLGVAAGPSSPRMAMPTPMAAMRAISTTATPAWMAILRLRSARSASAKMLRRPGLLLTVRSPRLSLAGRWGACLPTMLVAGASPDSRARPIMAREPERTPNARHIDDRRPRGAGPRSPRGLPCPGDRLRLRAPGHLHPAGTAAPHPGGDPGLGGRARLRAGHQTDRRGGRPAVLLGGRQAPARAGGTRLPAARGFGGAADRRAAVPAPRRGAGARGHRDGAGGRRHRRGRADPGRG